MLRYLCNSLYTSLFLQHALGTQNLGMTIQLHLQLFNFIQCVIIPYTCCIPRACFTLCFYHMNSSTNFLMLSYAQPSSCFCRWMSSSFAHFFFNCHALLFAVSKLCTIPSYVLVLFYMHFHLLCFFLVTCLLLSHFLCHAFLLCACLCCVFPILLSCRVLILRNFWGALAS